MSSPSPDPGRRSNAVAFLGMGFSAAASLGVGVLLGALADSKLHTSPWLLLAGIAVGTAAAIGSVVAQVRRFL